MGKSGDLNGSKSLDLIEVGSSRVISASSRSNAQVTHECLQENICESNQPVAGVEHNCSSSCPISYSLTVRTTLLAVRADRESFLSPIVGMLTEDATVLILRCSLDF